ncbi:MAG: hypothetical protein AB7O59_11105 [Pirellulales bacterium]
MAACLWMVGQQALAQGLVRDNFEGPDPALRIAGSDAHYRLEKHERVSAGAHAGQWCEHLAVRGNNGTYVYVSHDLPPARVIGELAPTVWVKADRPGVQLLVRVVLPRSTDAQTGEPLSTLIRGTAYEQVGTWQQLHLENFAQTLERHVRVLRAQHHRDVDAREAYVDRLLLNVYGGPGLTNVLVDDLEVAGVIAPQTGIATVSANIPQDGPTPAPQGLPQVWAGGAAVPNVERSGSVLLVGGKPFFARAVEYQGEAPVHLKSLGFNAAWLSRPPSAALLRDAAAAGLWIIAPPPPAETLETRAANAGAAIGGQYDAVLAWDLGRGLGADRLDATRRWAKLLQTADPRGRPMIAEAETKLTAYTRPPINVLVARRDVLGTGLQFGQYTAWLRQRSQLALPGTILWATIQTQPAPRLVEQMSLLSGGRAPQVMFQESQLRTLAFAALAGGARGLCFRSASRLDTNDPATRRRAAILELLNMELELIERFPATGSFTTTADSSDPHAAGAVVETDRSRLLLPMYMPANSQLVMGATSGAAVNFTVPGVPEEDNAFELSPVSFRPLDSKRVAGGTRVMLGELERDSLVVFTQDYQLRRGLETRLNQNRRRAAELVRMLATEDQIAAEVVTQRLASVGRELPVTRPLRIAAQTDVREFTRLLAANDLPGAYYRARHALAATRLIQRAHFDDAVGKDPWPWGDPWIANFATLDEHIRLTSELASAQRGPNLLAEGGCENLQRMIGGGWKHFRHEQPNITSVVDLSPQTAHSGQAGLRLQAVAVDPKNVPSALEASPMWVTTSNVNVERGQLLEIQAWVRVARPIVASVDGLIVVDTIGGEALAQRLVQAGEWQPVTLYRAVGQSGPMAVTFALSGLGEAWIDDVSIRVVARGTPVPPLQAQVPRR